MCDRADDPVGKARHIGVLVHSLSISGPSLDPLLVFPAGSRYFVIEGHHRLAAYKAVKWDEPIPVEVFVEDGSKAALKLRA